MIRPAIEPLQRLYYLLFSVLLLTLPTGLTEAQSLSGRSFHFTFMENLQTGSNGETVLAFSITSQTAANVRITYMAVAGFSMDFQIPGPGTYEYDIGPGELLPKGSGTKSRRSFEILSDNPVQVEARHYRLNFSESTRLFPDELLGRSYLVLCQTDGQATPQYPSQYAVVAGEDNTTVRLTHRRVSLHGTLSDSIMLNKGEVYTVQSLQDLSGSEVIANRPVAVFSGALRSVAYCSQGADNHLYEQIPPVTFWDTLTPVLPIFGDSAAAVKILASQDQTIIYSDCHVLARLNKGETFLTRFNEPILLRSNYPICVGRFASGVNCREPRDGDPSFMILPSFREKFRKTTFQASTRRRITDNAKTFDRHYLTLVAHGIPGSIKIDQQETASQFRQVGNTNVFYLQLPVTEGVHELDGDVPLYGYYQSQTFADMMLSPVQGTELFYQSVILLPDTVYRDTVIECPGDQLLLSSGIQGRYSWSTGSKASEIIIDREGHYTCRVEHDCWVKIYLFRVKERLSFITPDRLFACEKDTVEALVPNDVSVIWWDGDSSRTRRFHQSGRYAYCLASSQCQKCDTLPVQLDARPEIQFPNDTTVCGNDLMLENTMNYEVVWPDGAIASGFVFRQSGLYTLKLQRNNCVDSQQIRIQVVPPIELPRILACADRPDTLFTHRDTGDFLWSDGSSYSFKDIRQDTGWIWLRYSLDVCTYTDSLKIPAGRLDLPVFIPNAFTPNKREENEIFGVVAESDILNYQCLIYNRWGQLIFSSTDPSEKWDGCFKNEPCPEGVYLYMIRYQEGCSGKKRNQNGQVNLIR